MRDVLGIAQANRHTADRIAAALLTPDPRFGRTTDGRWTVATPPSSASPVLDACRWAIVDVETTGVRAFSGDRIMEAGEDRIPNRFDNAPALTLDNGKQNTVMAIDHRHVFDIALFFGVRSRSFDVAEQNGHGRAQLFQLLLGLRTRLQ